MNKENIEKINTFNLKKSKLMSDILDIYNDIKLDIHELSIKEQNPLNIINSICDIQTNLDILKQQITNYNETNNIASKNRYKIQYNNNDKLFWGIGLENESYLQGINKKVLGSDILKMIGQERYSVNYTLNYDIIDIKNKMSNVYKKDKYYEVAQMINAHSLDKIDTNCEHITTFSKEPIQNLNFTGFTVLEEWFNYDSEIRTKINSKEKTKTNIFFDGDTIEFITEKFYKTNTQNITDELINTKKWFIDKFNNFKENTDLWNELGKIDYVVKHPGLNIFRSMTNKIVFFNNTTIHIHLTLPTKIKNGLIVDKTQFNKIHSRAIKLIQWFEPFFICTLGSPDIMQCIFEKNNLNDKYFAKGSMRATLSRYIGVGTYDAEEMAEGKIITKTIESLRPNGIKWWRDMIKEQTNYNLPEKDIGLDFNYAKHYQSGLEFRLLDGIPLNILKDVLDIIILICEHSYSYNSSIDIMKCSDSQIWNNIVYKSMIDGYCAKINLNEATEFLKILGLNMVVSNQEILLEEFYYKVLEYMYGLYKNKDTFVIKYMTKEFDKINRWDNFNKIQWFEHIKTLENE